MKRKSEIQQTMKKAMYSYKELLTKRETETKCAKDPDPDWVPGLNRNDFELFRMIPNDFECTLN